MTKILLFLTISILSVPTFARTYIQCGESNSWNSVVINLNGESSTLFMTNGVHLPDELRILKKIILTSENQEEMIYSTNEGKVLDVVYIPVTEMQRDPMSFMITLEHVNTDTGYSQARDMYCFSSIYND